ncbi:uncharacterized protein LOC120152631 [Hibiscus syriacus]|uniref:uncharacterized protein LOC120152631 n=1 Tax=Hibiscus syriacus TaxID=106335 RepID=UPI001924EB10|nr:uncharacterized protein LOC120152631 [Hibiscus syriacus]
MRCFAGELNIKFDQLKVLYGSSLGELDESELDFKRREDETALVFYNLNLHKLLIDTEAMKREFERFRNINPALVFMLEFYVDQNESNFLTFSEDSFRYYSDIIDDYGDLIQSEFEWMLNIYTQEGEDPIRRHKTLTEWQKILSMAGFRQVPLTPSDDDLRWPATMREENGCLILGWEQRPTFFLSAWKPQVEDEHFNCNLNSHKLGPGFNSNSLLDSTIPPLQPFPEGWALNRVASFAEIYDILKDLCHKYDIPLALTWDSKVIGKNEKTSYPFKNRTMLIQRNSCYVKDWNSYAFMKGYGKAINIHKIWALSIVEKALESSEGFYFHPSIRNFYMENKEFLIQTETCGIDAAVAIVLRNYYSNKVYVVEFYWECEISGPLAYRIFEELKNM